MVDTIERTKRTSSTSPKREPKSVRITLWVCGCYKNGILILDIHRSQKISKILDITIEQLGRLVILAMMTGKPQIVACYQQRDITEQKLSQLQAQTPFIARACHSFDLAEDE